MIIGNKQYYIYFMIKLLKFHIILLNICLTLYLYTYLLYNVVIPQ